MLIKTRRLPQVLENRTQPTPSPSIKTHRVVDFFFLEIPYSRVHNMFYFKFFKINENYRLMLSIPPPRL